MQNLIIMPIFGLKEDDEAATLMESLFRGYLVKTIDCDEIADHGGVLNCITWDIRVDENECA